MASVSVFLMSVLGAVLLINFNTNSVQSREINIKEVTQRVRRSEECDAEDEYNSNVLCCAGTRYTLTFEHSRCCGKSAYNPITSICCGGVVQWNLRSQSRCCGRKPYNPMIYDCCGGRLIRRSHNNANGCCNGTPYDPRHFTCCQGKVSWRRGTGWCCGKRVFDGDSYICCNEILYPRSSRHERCCGKRSYNPEYYMCCEGKVTWKPGEGQDYYCCGPTAYDPRFYQCCSGYVQWRSGYCS